MGDANRQIRNLIASSAIVTLGLMGCALLGSALLGCDGGHRAGDLTSVANDPIPTPELSARRPTVHFYMERTTDRCEVYSVDGNAKSASEEWPCPEDMLLGERLRIAGMTCTRESTNEDRRLPVVCPDPLTNFEKAYRRARFGSP